MSKILSCISWMLTVCCGEKPFLVTPQMRVAERPVQQIRMEGFMFELQTAAAMTSFCSLSLLLSMTFL